ncbi:MAG: complement resistance protein TraT [Rhodospirillales bacterium]|nr:complement resistance protein TraT [Rhodospirillales bacterium]
MVNFIKMKSLIIVPILLVLSGCVSTIQNDLGMVRNKETGLAYGSMINGNLMTDPAFFPNKNLKLSIRNTSGDDAFKLGNFRERIESFYLNKGYDVTRGSDFGLKVDVNVVYSGQIQTDRMSEYAMIGGVAGGVAGVRSKALYDAALWSTSGAALGSVLGSFDTEDTYIIVAAITVGIRDKARKRRKVITFDRSERIRDYDDDESFGKWREKATIRLAVYAGGRNTEQSKIAEEVRRRISNIVGDII